MTRATFAHQEQAVGVVVEDVERGHDQLFQGGDGGDQRYDIGVGPPVTDCVRTHDAAVGQVGPGSITADARGGAAVGGIAVVVEAGVAGAHDHVRGGLGGLLVSVVTGFVRDVGKMTA